jgi:glutamate/tyrosine decarboxylase-like PLP-dependent enzyme
MPDPLELRSELERALALAAAEGSAYAVSTATRPVLDPAAEARLGELALDLPEHGVGAPDALAELASLGRVAAAGSSGPRFFHFVTGGATPAALGADWLTSAYDQSGFAWVGSPLAIRLETIAIGWLRALFDLPDAFEGALVTGATMANFTCLTAARSWWAERHGVPADEAGLADAPQPRILSGGYLHPTAVQAVGMLGLGRRNVKVLARDEVGRLDLDALQAELADGRPAIVIANAGEVNNGDFDPIAEIAALTEAHDAWLHVDGAFGLFARLAPESRPLTDGVEQADSITVDAHKWLNVPYDCGVAFVREPERLAAALGIGAPYLPSADDPHPNPSALTPENSRRARALAVWATLRAYGRDGYRAMVERHLRLARHLAGEAERRPQFELLAQPQLNVVCFRARPHGVDENELDALNRRLGAALLRDGRVFSGTTVYGGRVAFRPAIVNWQTTEADVEALLDVLAELLEEEA